MNQENLWAPWRMAYLRDLERKADAASWDNTSGGNFLLEYWYAPECDDENLVIYRDAHGIILLNRYPYTNGHLLVALGEACPHLLDYDPEQWAAFWTLLEIGIELVQKTFHPQGINTGINEGRAAGAGVPEHLHGHILPRWNGDTNFITVVGRVRVIPESLEAIAEQYRQQVAQLNESSE